MRSRPPVAISYFITGICTTHVILKASQLLLKIESKTHNGGLNNDDVVAFNNTRVLLLSFYFPFY